MLLFKYCLKRYSLWLLLGVAVLLGATQVWKDLAPPQLNFIRMVEVIGSVLAVIPISIILFEPTEIELGLACGIRTDRFAFTRLAPCLLYTMIPATVIAALGHYAAKLTDPETIGVIPLYVPDNYRVCMLISAAVTVLFFASLTFFLRVASRNCLVAFVGGLVTVMGGTTISAFVIGGKFHPLFSYVNPFISFYFIGDHVGNAFSQLGLQNVWTINRISFFVLSLLLLGASYLLLRREKLHEVQDS